MILRIRSLTPSRIRRVTSTMAKHVVATATMSPQTPTGCTSLGMNWRSWIIWLMAWHLLVICQQMFERSYWRKRTSTHRAHVGWRKRLSTRQTSWNYMDLSLNTVCLQNIMSYFILLLTCLCHDGISMTLIFLLEVLTLQKCLLISLLPRWKFLKIFKNFKMSPNFISFLPFGIHKQNLWNWMPAVFPKLFPIFKIFNYIMTLGENLLTRLLTSVILHKIIFFKIGVLELSWPLCHILEMLFKYKWAASTRSLHFIMQHKIWTSDLSISCIF